MKRSKFVSLLLSAAMILSLVSVPAAADNAVRFNDMEGHWGTEAVDRWSSVGIFKGNENGSFMPDKEMTRAEFAQMLVNLMGYSGKSGTKFADVAPDAWYADAISALAAAGVMQGDGVNAMPTASISREQSAVLLCRALHLAPGKNAKIGFADAGNVSSWAKDAVAALAERSMIAGVGDNNFAPTDDINRASVAQMIHNMISSYVTEDGAAVTGEQKGIVIVAAKDVKVDNATLTEPLILAPKAAGATVTLTGKTKAAQVVLSAEGGKTVVGKDATVTDVTVEAPKTGLTVSGKVDNVTVAAEASGTTLTVEKGATIKNVETSADKLRVEGAGKIGTLTIMDGKDVTISKETKVDRVVNKSENDVKVGDKVLKPGKTLDNTSSSGGGGSSAPSVFTVTYRIGDDTRTYSYAIGTDVDIYLPEISTDSETYYFTGKWTYTLAGDVTVYYANPGETIENVTRNITITAESFKAVDGAWTVLSSTYNGGADTAVYVKDGNELTVYQVSADTEITTVVRYTKPANAVNAYVGANVAALYDSTTVADLPVTFTAEGADTKYLKWVDANGKVVAVQKMTVTVAYTDRDPRS